MLIFIKVTTHTPVTLQWCHATQHISNNNNNNLLLIPLIYSLGPLQLKAKMMMMMDDDVDDDTIKYCTR